MALLLLIRHGKNDMVGKKLAGRLPDIHLNKEGKSQACRLAAELAAYSLKAVYASPLERAQETAEPIARVQGLPLEVSQEILEIDFGAWQGKSFKQLKRRKLWKAIQEQPSGVRFPDGESFVEAQARFVAFLQTLSQKYEEKDVVACIGHSDVIKLGVAYFLDMPLDSFQRIQISPASITFLFLRDDKAAFGPINQQSELSKISS